MILIDDILDNINISVRNDQCKDTLLKYSGNKVEKYAIALVQARTMYISQGRTMRLTRNAIFDSSDGSYFVLEISTKH